MESHNDLLAITAADLAEASPLAAVLLALNNAHEMELSPLTLDRLRYLTARAFAAWRIGEAQAFLLAFDQDADYDSPNFLWFRERFARFVYVDRIVVTPEARGQGHARMLYNALFERARAEGHDKVVCEVNSSPPNPGSDAFHAAFGFKEIGSAPILGGRKTVRYLMRALEPAAPGAA
jgi:predicted GNAT superfamily acetyltransferase